VTQKGIFMSFFIFIIFSSIIFTYQRVDAQMRIEYPKRFSFNGLIELTYTNYTVTSGIDGRKTLGATSTFEQYYRLGVEGYIYHPRLAVFDASIHFRDIKFTAKAGYGNQSKDIGYDINATFLPFRPVSLDLYARKIDYTVDWTGMPVDTSSNLYGARLRVNSRNLPAIRLEYYHWEYGLLRYGDVVDTIKIDRYTLDVRGFLNKLRTRYFFFADIASYTRPEGNYSVQDYRLTTATTFKNALSLNNYLGY
jgi:hypothetical protein